MTWTRLGQMGYELQSVDEGDASGSFGTGNPTISNTKAHTGSYSCRFIGTSFPHGLLIPGGENMVRVSMYVNHVGLSSSGRGGICVLARSGGGHHYIAYDQATNNLQLYLNGSLQSSINAITAGFSTTDRWYHVGVTFYNHASNGYFSCYIDGVQVLTYSGDTTSGGGGAIIAAYAGGRISATTAWLTAFYVDDFYIDYGSAEADAVVPSRRFEFLPVVANGADNEWNVVGAASAWQAVDDTTHDSDTTYVWADASSMFQNFQVATFTLPAGFGLRGIVPVVMVRKTDAGVDSQIALEVYQSPGVRTPSSDMTLTTSYHGKSALFLTAPSGAALTESLVNSMRYGFISRGTF